MNPVIHAVVMIQALYQNQVTHQLRVVAKALKAPLLGDLRYGGTKSDRTYLHSFHLSFTFEDKIYEYTSFPDEGSVFVQEIESFKSLILGEQGRNFLAKYKKM